MVVASVSRSCTRRGFFRAEGTPAQPARRALRADQKNPNLGPISELIRDAAHGGMLPVFNLDPGCCPLAIAGERFALIEFKLPLLGAKRSFRMGVAGWRFAHVKRNFSGRAAVVAVLEDWQVICSAVVAAGSMIMLGIMLYRDWPQ